MVQLYKFVGWKTINIDIIYMVIMKQLWDFLYDVDTWTESYVFELRSERSLKCVILAFFNATYNFALTRDACNFADLNISTQDLRDQAEQDGDVRIADLKPIKSLDKVNTYKFLGLSENIKQVQKQVIHVAAKTYLQTINHLVQPVLEDS